MKFVKKNNIWYKHNNNSDKLYNFFHGWTNYDSINDIEEEFENWHDLYEKTGWHPFIEMKKLTMYGFLPMVNILHAVLIL